MSTYQLSLPLPMPSGKSKINKEWHEKHRMPKNATLQQRITWHLAHAKNCACRPMPASIQQAIKSKIKL